MKKANKTCVCILEFDRFDPDEFLALLTPLRRSTIESISSERAGMQSAAAELAYLAAAKAAHEDGLFGEEDAKALHTDELIKRFQYSYAENGQPVLSGAFMSLSHTSGAALAAVSSRPIGADIERERRVSERISKRIMSPKEYARFILLPEYEKNAVLLECWTAKESFLKLTGEGILGGLNRLEYDGANAKIIDGRSERSAHVIRLDSGLKSREERESRGEGARDRGICACICCESGSEPRVLRFLSAQAAAGFVLNN